MFESLNEGDRVYRYIANGICFKVNEGSIRKLCSREYIVDGTDGEWYGRLPYKYKAGTVTLGMTIWMTERDDELAKNIFIEHERKTLLKLEKAIKNTKKRIDFLEGLSLK